MPISLELRLEERTTDRIVVSIWLTPDESEHGLCSHVDSVALELLSREKESLSPKTVLPIAGLVSAPIATRAELRSHIPIPPGAMVVAIAWCDDEPIRTSIPAEAATTLEAHIQGTRTFRPKESDEPFLRLHAAERAALCARLPWLGELEYDNVLNEVTEELGLSEEDAALLRDILAEDFSEDEFE